MYDRCSPTHLTLSTQLKSPQPNPTSPHSYISSLAHFDQAITKLMGLQPTDAILITNSSSKDGTELEAEEIIPTELVERGDILKIRPGDKIPCDGSTQPLQLT